MQTSNFWHKLHICRHKVLIATFLLLFVVLKASGQNYLQVNNPNYDDRFLSYGFLIGVHNTSFKINYSDLFVTNDFDTVHSIQPVGSPGFSLGFIVNLGLYEFFDVRILPKVAFYEHLLEYHFTDETMISRLKESTVVEFPIMVKYKSTRRKNSRMYMVTGLKPAFEASGRTDLEQTSETLNIQRFNLSYDFGFGFDIYFPLFKFSPEVRFSKGLSNMLTGDPNIYSAGIDRLSTNTINFYLLFQ